MARQNHTLPVSVGQAGKSLASWSLHPSGKILLFIHGFGGRATKTWRSFPTLLVEDFALSGCDIVFYAYDSRRTAALASATMLFDFINPFLSNPAYLVNQAVDLKRSLDFIHSEIYIIAHSLGAPIARRMLLRAWKNKSPWLPKVKIVFYAPATAGARVKQLERILPLTLFFPYFSFHWPVVDDLRTGSTFLEKLSSETRRAISSDGGTVFRSFGTFFGEHENVIELKQEWPWDSPYTIIPAKDHFSVCKPRKPQDAAYGHLKRLVIRRQSATTETRKNSSGASTTSLTGNK
jgi:pimeloyl-ACP methyl ester carboxylesterase